MVLNDGRKLVAKTVLVSSKYDFRFLRIQPPYPLKPLAWADSATARVGQDIMMIAHKDNQHSLRVGKINRLVSHEFLGVNLALNHGDSGSPILDSQGRLLGIVAAQEKSRQHAGLAIASNTIRERYLRWKRGGFKSNSALQERHTGL